MTAAAVHAVSAGKNLSPKVVPTAATAGQLRRYWFSDTYSDIAARVGMTEKNVSVRLTRIREKLRNYLTEREVLV